jgi:anti-repressor protein
MSTPLIPVTRATFGDTTLPTVNARDLHTFLEVGKDFSSWIKDRIEKYEFIENQDFVVFTQTGENSEGRPRIDYHLALDMAKELAMVERNVKGKQARQYFIECERRLNGSASPTYSIPPTYASALRLAADLQDQLEQAQPKIAFHDHVAKTETLFSLDDAAKSLRTGPRRLMKALKEWKVLQETSKPYQKYIDQGYFRVVPVPVQKGNRMETYLQPFVTGNGLIYLKAMMDRQIMAG